MVNWSFRKNWGYLVAILAVFLLAPHCIMSQPEFPLVLSNERINNDAALEAKVQALGQIYVLFVWLFPTLAGGIVALFHVLMGERFCPWLPIMAEASILTYLFHMGITQQALLYVTALSIGAAVILLVECFVLLGHQTPGRQEGLLAGAGENYQYLAALFGCSFVPLAADYVCVLCWNIHGAGSSNPFRMLLFPIVLALWIVPGIQLRNNSPLTQGGLAGTLVLYLVSALPGLLTGAWYDLAFLAVGYGGALLIALIRRRRGKVS